MGEPHNYFIIKGTVPWRSEAVYIDECSYNADRIFAKYNVPVKFFPQEMYKPESNYVVVRVSFNKKYTEEFKQCMEELWNSMPLFDHTDYQHFCENEFYGLIFGDQEGD